MKRIMISIDIPSYQENNLNIHTALAVKFNDRNPKAMLHRAHRWSRRIGAFGQRTPSVPIADGH